MCGIVGLHLRDPELYPRLGQLLSTMMCRMAGRGPDSAGVGLYGDERFGSLGQARVAVLASAEDLVGAQQAIAGRLSQPVGAVTVGETTVFSADTDAERLRSAVRAELPGVVVTSWGNQLAVLKGVGSPATLSETFALCGAGGWQGVAHTRMATESAVTSAHSHPFSVGPDLCLVHNGSFSNHATIRRQLSYEGVKFDSDNDSEVAARFVSRTLAEGADLDKALNLLSETFDGFYTLLVTTADSFAVVRDPIACKPAVIAETPDWVAMASEFQALASLPGIDSARIFEPEPAVVYTWTR